MSDKPLPSLDDGTITITLGDETLSLVPSIGAIKAISREFGGLTQAMSRVLGMDFPAYVTVIRYGCGADDRLAKRLERLVWKARMVTLTGALNQYLLILANGGQPLDQAADEGGDEGGDGDEDGEGNPPQAAGA